MTFLGDSIAANLINPDLAQGLASLIMKKVDIVLHHTVWGDLREIFHPSTRESQ